MFIEPIVFYTLTGSVFVLGASLVIFLASYLQTVKKVKSLEKEKENIHEEVIKILNKTHEKAFDIIAQAHKKAAEIIANTKTFSKDTENLVKDELDTLSQHGLEEFQHSSGDLQKLYQQELEEAKKDSVNILGNISKDVANIAKDEVSDFKEVLQKETVESQKIVEEKIEEAYKNAEKSVEEYKTKQIEHIQEKLLDVVKDATEEIIGKSLSLDDHNDLVIQALEKAKQELLPPTKDSSPMQTNNQQQNAQTI